MSLQCTCPRSDGSWPIYSSDCPVHSRPVPTNGVSHRTAILAHYDPYAHARIDALQEALTRVLMEINGGGGIDSPAYENILNVFKRADAEVKKELGI